MRCKSLMRIGIGLLLMGGSIFNVKAQSDEAAISLNLEDAVNEALEANSAIRQAGFDEKAALESYKETNAVFLPQVTASYSALTTNNPLNSFGFKLQQRSINASDFDPAFLNNPDATHDFNTKIEVQQPLLNFDMILMRKAARIQKEVYAYKTQRTKEYLSFDVHKAWYQLQMAYQAESVIKEALETARALFYFTNNRLNQGLIQKSDLLNVQVQVTGLESNLSEASANIKNVSDYLSILMNKPTGVVYKVPSTGKVQTDAKAVTVPDSRSDFMAIGKAIEASSMMVKSKQSSFLPRINAFGAYQLNDKELAGFNADSYLAGVQLSWDIFKGTGKKHETARQRIETEKLSTQLDAQRKESQMILEKSVRDLADNEYKIRQYSTAVEQATEALRILENRYKQGLANTIDVLIAQTQLSQQRFAHTQAIFNYNVTAAQIKFLTQSGK